MNFDSYTDRVVGTAVSLVNALTPGQDGGRPVELGAGPTADPGDPGDPGGGAGEFVGEIARRCLAIVGRPVTGAETAGLLALAGRLRPVFEAAEGGRADRVAELVNALLRDYRAAPELSRHDGEPWHLHYRSTAAGLATEWGAGCAVGLAVVVDSQATGRLGVCRAGCCDRVFVDVSRNASRRFCSEACLNRTKVAAFRARARATT